MTWPDCVTYLGLATIGFGSVVGLVMAFKPNNKWEVPMQKLRERVSANETKIEALEQGQETLSETINKNNDELRKDFKRLDDKIDRNHAQITGILLSMKAPK